MIYFDNAATTFPKPKCVIEKINLCLNEYCGNPSRSSHKLSQTAGEEIYRTREKVAELLHVNNPEGVVFTYNATYALNMAIKTMITEKCHVIISDIEHNSVVRPLEMLRKNLGITYSKYDSSRPLNEAIPPLIRPDTRFIISTLTSNVTGKEIDNFSLSQIAEKNSLGLILDASQAMGHKKIDLSISPCDALCAPGHKGLFGIQGTGFAYFKVNKRIGNFIEGGSGTNSLSPFMPEYLPEGYEAGTPDTVGISALGSGIDFINEIGINNIVYHENKLRNYCFEKLCKNNKIKLYESFGGIVLFNIEGISSYETAGILDKHDICTRAGLHCAPSAHKLLGTLDQGAVRLSFSIMNTKNEIDYFVKIINIMTKQK